MRAYEEKHNYGMLVCIVREIWKNVRKRLGRGEIERNIHPLELEEAISRDNIR